MKKGLKLFTLLVGSSLLLAGCDEFEANWPTNLPSLEEMNIDTPWVDYSNPCTAISFAQGEANVNLLKGDTHTYSYSVEPKDINQSKLVWESDNPEVATIENGLLTAVGGGKANISLSCGDVIARSLVTVTVPITDFNVNNKDLSLDIEGSAQIEYTLEPADTTQNKVSYETTSSIISVSETGLITALGETGDAEIKVTNEGLNKVETVNVHVSDMWNYVSSLSVTGQSKLEVTKSDILSTEVVAIDTTKDASTLATNSVTYSVKEGSESYVSVNPDSGEITGLEPGNATIVASLFDERNENTVTKEFEVEIFEVSATALTLSESGTLELDNNENSSHQLTYTYTLSDTSFTEPSRGNISFATSDNKIATVNDNGLIEVVGPGTATITVKDLTYDVSDSIVVNTTIYAKSITLAASGDFYLDESIEITANVVPADTSDNLVWDYDETSGHKFVENGNKLTVTCNNLDTPVDVKASVGSTQSNVITLTPKEREVLFEAGKTYIVGSSNFKTGVSKDVDGGSWNAAKYAFVMTDKTGNAHAKYEYKAVIDFRAGDEWKIRENVEDWRAISASNGRYKVDEGAFATGQMSVTSTPEEGNVLVNEAGKYDVYFAYYDDTETGWYEVYVEEHGMKLSSTSVHAKLTTQATVSTITASNFEGTLKVEEVDEEFITVSVDSSTGNISVTPVKVGETSFKVVDDVKEIEVSVEIKEGSDAEKTAFYIRGDAANGWGALEDFVLRESADDNNYGEILDVYLKAGSFKIADENWSEGTIWGYEYGGHTTVIGGAAGNFTAGDGDNDIKCNVAGYYDIYLTKNNYISIESAGVTPEPSPIYAYVLNGGDPVNLTVGQDPDGKDQLEAIGVEMKDGDSIFFENIAPDIPAPLSSLTFGKPDEACGFTILNGVLTASKDGKFNFYVKLIYGGDVVYISEVEDPTPVEDKDYVVKVCHDEVWSQLDMSQTVGDESQYEYTGDFDKDDIFVIHMYGETWYHFEDVKAGCLSLVSLEGSENIKFNAAGNYTIYADYDADKDGNHIWIKKNIAPATMTIEGSSPVQMTPYEKNPGEFVLTNVHLATNEFFSFEYDGVSVGYDNCKSSPVGVKSNQAKHIAVTTEGDYDIYFDTKAISGQCIYIAEHVEMITYTIDFGSSWAFGDGAKIFAWVWSENKWVECTRVGTTNSVTVELTAETTGFNFVRADSSKTTSTVGWPPNGSWNQSSDLNATSGTYSYSLPWNG